MKAQKRTKHHLTNCPTIPPPRATKRSPEGISRILSGEAMVGVVPQCAVSARDAPHHDTDDRPTGDRPLALGVAAPRRRREPAPVSTQGTSRASLLRLESALHDKAPGLPKVCRPDTCWMRGKPFAHHSTTSQIDETLSRHDHPICCELWGQDQAANHSRQTQTWPLTQAWPEGAFHGSFPATTHSSEIITES